MSNGNTYDAKITAFKELLTQFNTHIDEDARVDVEGVVKKLRTSGATTDEALKACSWEDIKDCGVPVLLAKQAAKIFRGKVEESAPTDSTAALVEMLKGVDKMEIEELVQKYDPAKPKSPVAVELSKRFANTKPLVFTVEGEFDREATLERMRQIEQGLPVEDTHFYKKGGLVPAYAVGQGPSKIFDLCPIEKTILLSSQSSQLHLDWSSVDRRTRQLVAIAAEKEGLTVAKRTECKALWRAAKEGFDTVAEEYPEAAMEFRSRETLGTLPTLTTDNPRYNPVTSKPQNPFGHKQF